MLYIERTMGETIKSFKPLFPVISLTGPRQSGKTTLSRHIFPDLPYINMENVQTLIHFQENPVSFLNSFKCGVIIDEAQLEPGIFKALQVVVDDDLYNEKERIFIITGSSNFSLMSKISESMAGRVLPLTLLPLSVKEILDFHKETISTSDFMFLGGYPKVWISSKEKKNILIQSYIDTYVEKDLRQLLNIKDLNKFIKFLGLCAGRTGTELNRSSIAVETGVTVATIDSWLSVLEASYIIWLLKPWSTNLNKRLTKSPKLYFYDTGLLCSLLGIREAQQLEFHPLRGQIFENMVINNFVKAALNSGNKPNLFFFRNKTGREIDLIYETSLGLKLFEIKASTGFNPDYFKNMRFFEENFPEKIISSSIIYDGPTVDYGNSMSGIFNFRDSVIYQF